MWGALIGGALQLGGAIANAAGSASANRNRQRQISASRAGQNSQYLSELFADPTGRKDNAAILSQLDARVRRANEIGKATSKITGTTQEQRTAQQQNNANAYSDAVSRIAAMNDSRKDMIRAQKRQSDMHYNDQDAAMAAERMQTWSNFAQNAFNAGNNIISSGIDFDFGKEKRQ